MFFEPAQRSPSQPVTRRPWRPSPHGCASLLSITLFGCQFSSLASVVRPSPGSYQFGATAQDFRSAVFTSSR
jgi:hypothetical protein